MNKSLFERLEQLPKEAFINGKVYFKPIKNELDLAYAVLDCKLLPEQTELVNPAGFSIGRAYLNPRDNYPCVICTLDNKNIGFINLLIWPGNGNATSWSYYIDIEEQGKGYGYAAAKLAVSLLNNIYPNTAVRVSTEQNNIRAQKLYISLGFKKLDELDGDDLVFEYFPNGEQ